MPGLTVYRASAGSGKTFAITREYIHLLFRDPDNYRRILGVTFTNKATAEMKGRIIAELDKLAKGLESGYAVELAETFSLSPAELKRRASEVLSKILHDYSHFSILTIDSFFQRIIRAFAREIGFYQGFDIELDHKKILTAAIDQMIFELDSNPELKDWLVKFAEERILAGASWNVNRNIENLGQEVFKEKFNKVGETLLEKITDKAFLETFGDELTAIRLAFEAEVRQKGQDGSALIRKYHLANDDFKGKSRSIAYFFEKLSRQEMFNRWEISDTIRNHFNDPERWAVAGSAKNADILDAYHAGLNRLLGEIIEAGDVRYPLYQSVLEVQKHFYVLGVVADLLRQIKNYTSGKNIFLISDTARLLRKLIGNADAPFIYERTGTFIRHFMIDEFQDTSALQWQNFQPLILNSLAEGHENWVVGDIKQSIYRWRNSDWTILSEKLFSDLYPYQPEIKPLDYNWRSCFQIIRFNNSFFKNALNVLLNDALEADGSTGRNANEDFRKLLTGAYNAFAQMPPEGKKKDEGLVRIEFIPKCADYGQNFQDQALEKLPAIIEYLQDYGYHLSDIAILCRTRKEGDKVSEYLLKYQKQQQGALYRYDVLSGDSLLLKNSEAVKWMLSAFKYIARPGDELNKTFLVYEFAGFILADSQDTDLHVLFSGNNPSGPKDKLEEFFMQKSLRQYSVYELSDKLVQHFGLSRLKGELPFIQAFQDMLQEYSIKEPVDLNSFLQWWDENQDSRVINMPEEQDAIRLMTLHTAKGLEFKIVLLPFADWTLMKSGYNSDILWCTPETGPFNRLELLPVNLSKVLQNTIFSKDYFSEKALSYVDNLNLLYVAFTRAIDGLYVFAPETGKDTVDNSMADLIALSVKVNAAIDTATSDFPEVMLADYWNEPQHTFLFGNLPPLTRQALSLHESISIESLQYVAREVSTVARQVIQADEYFSEDGRLASQINTGKVMHEVFQRIKTVEDVDNALLALLLEGKISELDVQKLTHDIKKLLQQGQVKDWFTRDWDILTEAGILLKDGSMARPDRVLVKGNNAVVIDYKFGETEQESHVWQVRNYLAYLRQMGYEHLEGFLWYVSLGKIISVSVTNPVQGTLF